MTDDSPGPDDTLPVFVISARSSDSRPKLRELPADIAQRLEALAQDWEKEASGCAVGECTECVVLRACATQLRELLQKR